MFNKITENCTYEEFYRLKAFIVGIKLRSAFKIF